MNAGRFFFSPMPFQFNRFPNNFNNNFINNLNINNNLNNNSSLIKFYFNFTSGQKFEIIANPNELFKSVFDKFINEQCPQEFKNKIQTALADAKKIDFNKSLLENNIKANSRVVLVIKNSMNVDQNTYTTIINRQELINANSEQQSPLSLDDEDRKALLDVYVKLRKIKDIADDLMNAINKLNINNNNNNNNSCNKIDSQCPHLHCKKHKHGLVLLFSNRDWICKICKKNYSANETSYYCSLCDYNICDGCIGEKKKYHMKKCYHQQTKLKYLNGDFHEHKMIYCRTSRSGDHLSRWKCNLCKESYSNKIWSFYCTYCDYDLCLNCAKKYF